MAKIKANREVCNGVVKDYATQTPIHYIDYANVTTTEVTGEVVYAYGGYQHGRKVSFTGEKGGTIAFECQIQPFELFSIMSGADISDTGDFVVREVITATEADSLTISKTAVAGTINVFTLADDCGTPMTGITAAGTTVSGTFVVGTKYVVYYEHAYATGARVLHVDAQTYPGILTIEAETLYKDSTGATTKMLYKVYKCQPQPGFTITNSNNGDPGTLTFTCDLMTDDDGNFIDMIELANNAT